MLFRSTSLRSAAADRRLVYRAAAGAALGFISLPLFIPDIVLGLSLMMLLGAMGLSLSLAAVVLGHLLICVPFALTVLIARLESFDRNLEEASADLGEDPWMTFWRVSFPLVLPGITFGLAALVYFSLLGFRPSIELMVAGHLIVTMPFILRTTTASLSQLDPAMLDSSQSLGASWLYTLRRVTLPLIFPGIAAGAFLAFMASIDNVPVSLFLSTARTDMLPIRMWGMMESTLDPRIAAVSGVLIAAAFLLMLLMEWTVGLTRRMRD